MFTKVEGHAIKEQRLKLMELAEMAKLITLIKENTLTNFILLDSHFWTFCKEWREIKL